MIIGMFLTPRVGYHTVAFFWKTFHTSEAERFSLKWEEFNINVYLELSSID